MTLREWLAQAIQRQRPVEQVDDNGHRSPMLPAAETVDDGLLWPALPAEHMQDFYGIAPHTLDLPVRIIPLTELYAAEGMIGEIAETADGRRWFLKRPCAVDDVSA